MSSQVIVYLPKSLLSPDQEALLMSAVHKAVDDSIDVKTLVRISEVPANNVEVKFFDFNLEIKELRDLYEFVGLAVRFFIDKVTEQNLQINLTTLNCTVTGKA